ncbi:MAG TPA: hypothetical protein VH442_00640, partial [Micromonosporaceae bacterium]
SGIIAFLSALLTALQGEHTGFDTVTAGQWITAVLAFFVAVGGTGAVTHQVRNRPASESAATPGDVPDPAPAPAPGT